MYTLTPPPLSRLGQSYAFSLMHTCTAYIYPRKKCHSISHFGGYSRLSIVNGGEFCFTSELEERSIRSSQTRSIERPYYYRPPPYPGYYSTGAIINESRDTQRSLSRYVNSRERERESRSVRSGFYAASRTLGTYAVCASQRCVSRGTYTAWALYTVRSMV